MTQIGSSTPSTGSHSHSPFSSFHRVGYQHHPPPPYRAYLGRACLGLRRSHSSIEITLATLSNAKNAAVLNLSSGGALNEARAHVGIALSNLIHDHGPPTPLSIDKAKRAIDSWIWELEASPAA
jgi:hypothetical protein